MDKLEFKAPWEVIEHNWSDTSIVDANDKNVATLSIYDEATEDTQEELEIIMSRNAKLIASAPELLESLQSAIKFIQLSVIFDKQPKGLDKWIEVINKAVS